MSGSTRYEEPNKTLIVRRELYSDFLLYWDPSKITHVRLLSVSRAEHFKSLSSLLTSIWCASRGFLLRELSLINRIADTREARVSWWYLAC